MSGYFRLITPTSGMEATYPPSCLLIFNRLSIIEVNIQKIVVQAHVTTCDIVV